MTILTPQADDAPRLRFYAEYDDSAGDLEISPVFAPNHAAAVRKAREFAVGRGLQFRKVGKRWDALVVDGRTILREDLQRIGDVNMLMSNPRREGRQVAEIVDDVMGRAAE